MRIFNSIVLATALAAPFASAASAAPFDGPYVGAQVGWQSEKMRDVKSSFGTVPVDGRTFLMVPNGDYTETTTYEIKDGKVNQGFKVRGSAYHMVRAR